GRSEHDHDLCDARALRLRDRVLQQRGAAPRQERFGGSHALRGTRGQDDRHAARAHAASMLPTVYDLTLDTPPTVEFAPCLVSARWACVCVWVRWGLRSPCFFSLPLLRSSRKVPILRSM